MQDFYLFNDDDDAAISTRITEASIVDDAAYPIILPAAETVAAIRTLLAIAVHTCRLFGFTLNFAPRKLAVIIQAAGVKAQSLKADLEASGNTISFKCGNAELSISVVKSYVHLGSRFGFNGSVAPDVVSKVAQMYNAARQYHKQILSNQNVAIQVRTALATSLVLSKSAHNRGCWPALQRKEARPFTRCYVQLFRRILGRFGQRRKGSGSDARALLDAGYGRQQLYCQLTGFHCFRVYFNAGISLSWWRCSYRMVQNGLGWVLFNVTFMIWLGFPWIYRRGNRRLAKSRSSSCAAQNVP